ncbi:MAG: hypothetical protein ACRBB4_17105, partial [Neptuniibacter sp.]
MLSKFKCVLAAATLLVASTGVSAGAVSTIGNVSESGGVYTITTGTGSVSDSALETFGGFYAGALDAEMGTDVIEGSAIKSTIEVEAGDTLSFDWVWDTDDYLPYNDFAFVGLSLLGIEDILASVAISGDYGTTSGSYSWTAGAAGVLTYVIGVVDVGDSAVTSYLNVS